MTRSGKLAGALVLVCVLPAVAQDSPAPSPPSGERVEAGPTARPVVSIALGSLPVVLQPHPYIDKAEDRLNPLANEPDQGRRGTWNRSSVPEDPLAATSLNPDHRTPSPLLTFA
ncbi:MAG: hypothetical protein ABI689_16485, partial [Thermoanaerobaculia bacterium]